MPAGTTGAAHGLVRGERVIGDQELTAGDVHAAARRTPAGRSVTSSAADHSLARVRGLAGPSSAPATTYPAAGNVLGDRVVIQCQAACREIDRTALAGVAARRRCLQP